MWSNVEAKSCAPAPTSRSKHAVCASSDPSGCIYLLGGRSANLPMKDLWKFDSCKNIWEEIHTKGHCPPSLQEHSMVFWKNSLYVFGGEIGFASTGETPLWILDLSSLVWRKIAGNATLQPSGRRGHSAVIHNGSMYVYGGYQDLRGSSSELWSLDLGSEHWHMVSGSNCLEQPPARHSHSCVVSSGAMWVYGGLTDLQPRCDLWKWDFELQEWYRLKVQRGPGELFGHAAFKGINSMFVYGGEKAGNTVSDLWRYNLVTEFWEKVPTEGALPPSRCHQIAILSPSMTDETNSQKKIYVSERSEFDECRKKKVCSPPKSLSMCFSQSNSENSRKRNFRFKVHPTVSRFCSKNTGSDDDDDDEYTVGYNHYAGQVNLRSLRDRISSSRLVRSISSGSYSILHNQATVTEYQDEIKKSRGIKTTPTEQNHPYFNIQKSQSSDAVLESDEVCVPNYGHPAETPESLTGAPVWVDNPNASLSPTSWSDGHPHYYHHSRSSTSRANNNENSCTSATVRPSRLSYDGPLSTVKDVEEESSENADEANIIDGTFSSQPTYINGNHKGSQDNTELLVNLDEPEVERARYPSRFASSYTVADLQTRTSSNAENQLLPHSISHSSGYHSFTDEDCESHKEFAGCLNSTSVRKKVPNLRDVELKSFAHYEQTFAENEKAVSNLFVTGQKERARSWDRSCQRKPLGQPSSGSLLPKPSPTTLTTPEPKPTFASCGQSSNGMECKNVKHTSRMDDYALYSSWNICIYLIGGPEQEAPGMYRQPIGIWKLCL